MYQTILELDNKAVIIKYKASTTMNKHRVGIQAKKVLLNFSEVTPITTFWMVDPMESDYIPSSAFSTTRILTKSC